MTQSYKYTIPILLASLLLEAILFYLYYFPETKLLAGDEIRYLATAKSILNGGDWHPHLLWPPLHSVTLAFFIFIFGDNLVPFQLFQYLLIVATAWIIRDLINRELNCSRSAQIGFAVILLLPSWVVYSQFLWPEAIHVFLFSSIIWINYCKRDSKAWFVLSGILMACALLYKSLLLLFVPFLFWPSLREVFLKKDIKTNSINMFIQVIVMLIALAPFSFHTKNKFDSWMISNSSNFNIHAGLNDASRNNFKKTKVGGLYRDYMKSAKTFLERERIVKQKIEQHFNEKGVINVLLGQLSKQYFRLFENGSFFSRQLKGEKEKGQLNKYSHYKNDWVPKILLIFDKFLYTLCLTAVFFVLILKTKGSVLNQQMLLFLFYTLGLFLLLHVKSRFRIPLVPIYAVCASQLYYYIVYQKLMVETKPKVILAICTVLVLFLTTSSQILDRYFPI